MGVIKYDQEMLRSEAKRLGITVQSLRKRIRSLGMDRALHTKPMNRSDAGKLGAQSSPWRDNLRLPGSRPPRS